MSTYKPTPTFIKVLVCGGRDFPERDSWKLHNALERWHSGLRDGVVVSHLIHGDARGIDRCAGHWAYTQGIQEVVCPANWDKKGKGAGPARNLAMLALGPDLVLAFPGGTGTAHMKRIARDKLIPVSEVLIP